MSVAISWVFGFTLITHETDRGNKCDDVFRVIYRGQSFGEDGCD